jgi:hypothetical protein
LQRKLLSVMVFAGWLRNCFVALEVLRTFWVLPTTVLPVLPSLRDYLSNSMVCFPVLLFRPDNVSGYAAIRVAR